MRLSALGMLFEMGPYAKRGVPAIARCLADEHADVRRWSAHALRRTGTADKTALDALRRALQDDNEGVRKAAKEALDKLEKK
jgi:HEAT repeat protein